MATTQVAEREKAAIAASRVNSSHATKPGTYPGKPARGQTEAFGAAGAAPPASRHGSHRLVTALLVIVVGLLAWGLFQGVLGLALRVAEYVAVALLSGWVGYRAGHWRGRREPRER